MRDFRHNSAPAVQRFQRNAVGQDWVVGDIHGCFTTLDCALESVDFDPRTDRLFSVGDLTDRGPESTRALHYLMQPWFHAIRGNHEQFLLEAQDNFDTELLWLANGGGWYFEQPDSVREAFLLADLELPLLIEVETECGLIGIAHADVPTDVPWTKIVESVEQGDERTENIILWSRRRVTECSAPPVQGVYRVYCGHTPIPGGVRIVGNVYFIDQGAVYGLISNAPETGLTLMPIVGDHPWIQRPMRPPKAG